MVARPPLALAAATWDPLARAVLDEGARGTVHSVFEQAVNLSVPDGRLIGVVGPAAGNGPATVVLRPSAAPPFLASGIDVGQVWAVDSQCLVLAVRRVSIDLADVRLWPATPTRRSVPIEEAARRLRRGRDLAAPAAPSGGLGPLLVAVEWHLADGETSSEGTERTRRHSRAPGGAAKSWADPLLARASAAARDLVAAWRASDPTGVGGAATLLSGLGPGLTPSGDDLLAGFLIGIERAGGPVFRPLADAVVAATTGRTTDVAVARVAHAANGLIEERMEAVVAAILSGDGRDLDAAVARAATWGHTSGVDTLVGLFLGIATVPPDLAP